MPLDRPSLRPLLLWTALVAIVLLAPGGLAGEAPSWVGWLVERGGDKLGHAALFFGEALFVAGALGRRRSGPGAHWPAALVAAFYGLVLEGLQRLVPGRAFEVADVLANTVGAFAWPLARRWLGRL